MGRFNCCCAGASLLAMGVIVISPSTSGSITLLGAGPGTGSIPAERVARLPVTGTGGCQPPSGQGCVSGTVLHEFELDNLCSLLEPEILEATIHQVGRIPEDLFAAADFPNRRGAGCALDYEWRAGPPIEIIDAPDHWPRGQMLEQMRPGDVIGLSVRARDQDYLVHTCYDCGGQSVVTKWGPFEDIVTYSWSITPGDSGTLIQSGDSQENMVMFKIPICGWGPEATPVSRSSTVQVFIGNEATKGLDLPIEGTNFVIQMTKNCSSRPGWINVSIADNAGSPPDEVIIPEGGAGECQPTAPVWYVGSPIAAGGIDVLEAPGLCPDYLALLSLEASDSDLFELGCTGPEDCPGGGIQPSSSDALTYEWSVIEGAGGFPLGNMGASVIFRRSRSSGAKVRCRVTDSGTRYGDSALVVEIDLAKAKPVRAYVAIGDITDAGWGSEATIRAAADIAETRYAAAGYVVNRNNAATASDVYDAFKNPCYQALWIVSHGGTTSLLPPPEPPQTRLGMARGTNVFSGECGSISMGTFGCREQPFMREIVLHGCELSNPDWYNLFVCPKVIMHKHKMWPARGMSLSTNRTPLVQERKNHYPPPAHNLSLD